MRRFLYNDPRLKQRRKELKEKCTEAEDLLWSNLRNKQIKTTKFYRQYSIGSYILDFYCPKFRLGIELDGKYHLKPEQRKYDKERTGFLRSNDIKLLRFQNTEVEKRLNEVLQKIEKVLS